MANETFKTMNGEFGVDVAPEIIKLLGSNLRKDLCGFPEQFRADAIRTVIKIAQEEAVEHYGLNYLNGHKYEQIESD